MNFLNIFCLFSTKIVKICFQFFSRVQIETQRFLTKSNLANLTERAQKKALHEGALVDVKEAPLNALPYPAETFDLIIVREHLSSMSPERRVGCLQEAFRVLRSGGRCMVIEPAPRGGLAAILIKRTVDPHHSTAKATERALEAEGFKGIRRLAEREGTAFIEGIKPLE